MITVIYDDQCQLCQNSIDWLSKRLSFTPLGYHVTELEKFGLTLAECEKQVYAISGDQKYGGVAAVIFLLKARGNRVAAFFLQASGPIGAFCYKWIAKNRQSLVVRVLLKIIKKLT